MPSVPPSFRFCANLSFLFTELPFAERFAAAAACGFAGVEFLFPYDWPAAELAARLAENRLQQVLFNLPAGDWAAGERGIACLPGREDEFRAGVELGITYARALGCQRLHALAGLRPEGVDAAAVRACYVGNLGYAARRCADAGIRLLIEPINSRVDMPGYWLDTPAQAMATIEAVGDDNLQLQFDIYHAQIMGGDLTRQLAACLPRIGHIQIADNPGRHQPGTGEIAYDYLFRRLAEWGYSGWIGCEYRPTGTTADSFGWREKFPGGG